MVGIGGARELETVEHRERVQSQAAFNHSSSVISDNTPSYDTEKPYTASFACQLSSLLKIVCCFIQLIQQLNFKTTKNYIS